MKILIYIIWIKNVRNVSSIKKFHFSIKRKVIIHIYQYVKFVIIKRVKKYRENNSQSIKEVKSKYRKLNQDKILEKEKERRNSLTIDEKKSIMEYNKNYQKENKDHLKEQKRQYYIKNREKIIKRVSENSKIRKDEIKEYRVKYNTKRNQIRNLRRKNDTLFNLECRVRSLFYGIFKNSPYKKNSKTYEILGCNFKMFKEYLESKFEPWMTWENRGLYNGSTNYGWDIDHIIPISSATTEDDFLKLNHYSNLQPLCGYVNRYIKRNLIL